MKLPQRILLLAPHPDDEVLMAAGVIRRGLLQGARVTVAVVTDGAYLGDGQKAKRRRAESLAALGLLGLGEGDVLFLNYPDTGMEPEISFLHTLYHSGGCAGYQKPALERDLDGLLNTVKPGLVIAPSRWDMHGDHAGLYCFARDAVTRLGGAQRPQIWQSLIHSPAGDGHWPQPGGALFTMPPGLEQSTNLKWEARLRAPLPRAMLCGPADSHLKLRAIRQYRSQLDFENEPEVARYLLAFAKREEIFWSVEDEHE